MDGRSGAEPADSDRSCGGVRAAIAGFCSAKASARRRSSGGPQLTSQQICSSLAVAKFDTAVTAAQADPTNDDSTCSDLALRRTRSRRARCWGITRGRASQMLAGTGRFRVLCDVRRRDELSHQSRLLREQCDTRSRCAAVSKHSVIHGFRSPMRTARRSTEHDAAVRAAEIRRMVRPPIPSGATPRRS